MQTLQPLTLVQAVGLARLQEEKLLDTRHILRSRPPPVVSLPPSRPMVTPSLLPSPPHPPPSTLKCLSPKEIASHRESGLCFNCDEKYHRGHRCASRVFLLVADEEDAPLAHIKGLDPPPDPPDTHDPFAAQISFNSLAGHMAPETLRLLGMLVGH